MGKNIVHVIGTGTIGEPLVGLLAIRAESVFERRQARRKEGLWAP